MIGVSEYIKKLLYEQDCVVVPELGGFLSHFNHAAYSGISGLYHSPAKRVAFNEALKLDDGLLIHYISVNEQIKREDAQVRVRQFVDEVKLEINKLGNYQLSDIGVLLFNQEGSLLFEPNNGINFFQEGYGLKSIPASTVTPQVSIEYNESELDITDRLPVEQPIKPVRWRSKVAMYSSSILLVGGLFYASSDTSISSSSRSSFNPLDLFTKKTNADITKKIPNIRTDSAKWDTKTKIEISTVENKKPIILPKVIGMGAFPVNKIESELVINKVPKPKVQVTSDINASFFIIAGAFAKQGNAQRLAEKLKKLGYSDASVMTIGDNKLYKVSVVGLSSQARAVSQMPQINKIAKAR